MREFYLHLEGCFSKGLRPTKSLPKGSQYASYLLNSKPTKVGLEPFFPIIAADTYNFTWPWPQVIITDKHHFIGYAGNLFLLGTSTVCANSSGTNPWEVMSFKDFVVIAKNGTVITTWNQSDGLVDYSTFQTTFPIFGTGINFKGQAIVGDLLHWPTSGTDNPGMIAAGNIGEFNFLASLKNESMMRPVHWEGSVYHIRNLGDDLAIVYGDDGIAGLYTKPDKQYIGYKGLANYGIYGKGAVCEGNKVNIFLGADSKLRKIDEKLNVTLLDFYEYMSLLSGNIRISYDALEDNFYICDGSRCFVLHDDMLYECYQLISSCGPYGSNTAGAFYDTGNDYFLGVTDVLDFGMRGMKTINTIELQVEDGDYSVALDWRNNPSDSFTRTSFVSLNDAGVATIICTARDFRLVVKCDDYNDVNVSYATIIYKMSDMTSIRGIYSPPPRGQNVS